MNREANLSGIKILIVDVEGVLTDGHSWQDDRGEWRRYFSVRDNMGLKALQKTGVLIVAITPLDSEEIRKHCKFVGFDVLIDACGKKTAFERALRLFSVRAEECVYVSVDAIDASWLPDESQWFGVGARFANENPAISQRLVYRTSNLGGDGAVLEISNLLRTGRLKDTRGTTVGL